MKIQYKIMFCVLIAIPLTRIAQAQEKVNEYVPSRDLAGYTATFGAASNAFNNRLGAALPTLIPDKTFFSLSAKTTNGSVMGSGLNGNPKPGSQMFDYRLNTKLAVPFAGGRMMFYVDGGWQKRQDLAENGAGTKATGKILTSEDAAAIAQKMQSYGFDIGSSDRVTLGNQNWNINAQLLFKLGAGERLSLKGIASGSDISNLNRDDQSFRFGNIAFTEKKSVNAMTIDLQSDFNKVLHNQLQAGYLNRKTSRDPNSDPNIPQAQIEGRTPGTMIYLGGERNATVYDITEKGLVVSDNFHIRAGDHNLTLGSYDEFLTVDYNYMNGYNGRVDYKAWTNGTPSTGIDAFLANPLFFPQVNADETMPFRVRGTFNFNGNDRDYLMANPSASFKVNNLSAYIQDEIIVNEHFRITPAVRVDWTMLPALPQLSEKMATVVSDGNFFGQYATYAYTPAADILNKGIMPNFSPRVGALWNSALGSGTVSINAVSGLYTSPVPLGLLAGLYYNNGRTVGAYDEAITSAMFSGLNQLYHPGKDGIVNFARLNGQVVDNPLTGVTEINLLDNKFKLPSTWNTEFNAEYVSESKYKIGWNANFGYMMHGLFVQSINNKDQVTYYRYDIADRVQPIYSGTKIDGRFTNIFLLTNRNKGYNYKLGMTLEKEYFKALTLKAAYAYGMSKDLMSSAKSNFDGNYQYNPALIPNKPKLAFSDNDIRHTVKTSARYKHAWANGKGETAIEITYNGMSGQPYTYGLTNSTIQNSGQYVNLLYIPGKGETTSFFKDYSGPDGTITAASQAGAFDAFVDNDSYLSKRRGKYTERNAGRTPWNNSFDLKISQTFLIKGQKLIIDLEIFNLLAQTQYFVHNAFGTVVNPGLNPVLNSQNKLAVQTAGKDGYGVPVYQFVNPATPYSVNYFMSRFRPQLGIAYSF